MDNVLVVGAGPVGLTMAAELARHGVRPRIIDKLAEPLPYCRAIGVTPRTLEAWDDMGVARQMIDAGLWLTGTRSIVSGSPPRDLRLDLSDLPYGHLGIPQPRTERILTEHLAKFGVAVERPVALTSLAQEEEGVHVVLEGRGGAREHASFRYVVGCDGAHSAVRRLLNIAFDGDHFPISFMLGDVMFEAGLPRGMALRSVRPAESGPPDFFVAIPLPEANRYRVSMVAPNERSKGSESATEHGLQTGMDSPSLDDLQQVADRLLPDKIALSDLRWSSLFRISMRIAAEYRSGNVFLAGDAAHIHPPTGGQGMNTGIQDAYNLAWKMALVTRNAAPASLLDSYHAERHPVGAATVSRTREQSERLGREAPREQERLADTQILIHYRDSKWVKDDVANLETGSPPRAGDRAPDCGGLRREHVNYPLRLFDVTRGTSAVLIVYLRDVASPGFRRSLENILQRLNLENGLQIRMVVITAPGTPFFDLVGAAILHDSDGAFFRAYSPSPNCAFVIRPDGYVGYHARPLTESGIMEYLETADLRV